MVHRIQATQALIEDKRNVRFYTLRQSDLVLDKCWVVLDRFWLRAPRNKQAAAARKRFPEPDYDNYWCVPDPERVSDLLQRPDLTRRDDKPVVAGNFRRHLLAFAVGPAELPGRFGIQAVWDLERQVFASPGPGQPEWWVLDGVVGDPFNGGTDAKAGVAKWD